MNLFRRMPRQVTPSRRFVPRCEELTPRLVPASLAFNITNLMGKGGGAPADLSLFMIGQDKTKGGAWFYFDINQTTGVGTPVYISAAGVVPPVSLNSLPNAAAAATKKILIDDAMQIDAGRLFFATSTTAVSANIDGSDTITTFNTPGAPSASYYYDFIEYTLNDPATQLYVDTSQVDQFGFPMTLSVSPADSSYAGTEVGITAPRSGLLADFKDVTKNPYLTPYQSLVDNAGSPPYRILSPYNGIVKEGGGALSHHFDAAIDAFFNDYTPVAFGGSGKQLKLISNAGVEYTGAVTTFTQGANTYTVLQFVGNSQQYNVFYPFFSTNNPAGHTPAASQLNNTIPPPPAWWGVAVPGIGTLTTTEFASQMVFGCDGVFADDSYQYWNPSTQQYDRPSGWDHTVMGNLENQVATAFNRGYALNLITVDGGFFPRSGNPSAPTDESYFYVKNATGIGSGMNLIAFGLDVPMVVTGPSETVADSPYTGYNVRFPVSSPGKQTIKPLNPGSVNVGWFYRDGDTWNGYSKFLHSVSINDLAYAFGFDDNSGYSTTLNTTNATLVSITLHPWQPNQLPVALPDTAVTRALTPIRINVLARDYDADGDPLRVVSVTRPRHGVAAVVVGRFVIYHPRPGFVGIDRFVYRITDGHGHFAQSLVTIRVLPRRKSVSAAVVNGKAHITGAVGLNSLQLILTPGRVTLVGRKGTLINHRPAVVLNGVNRGLLVNLLGDDDEITILLPGRRPKVLKGSEIRELLGPDQFAPAMTARLHN